jgi:hypothetical protein
MIIGAQKCGTTSLAAQLAEHPGICFCKIKEPGYFHKTMDWQSGLDAYHQLYEPKDGQLCGEASTMYTFLPEWQGTHTRLFAYNRDLKLIYIMRNPIERVISNYSHDLVRGLTRALPETAIYEYSGYINRSRYAVQIRPYLELFPRDSLLLLVFEDYVADQTGTLEQVARFLGIPRDPFQEIGTAEKHKSVGRLYLRSTGVRWLVRSSAFQSLRPRIPVSVRQAIRRLVANKLDEKPYFSPELRQTIWRFVEDDVQAIEALLGRTLGAWREREEQ